MGLAISVPSLRVWNLFNQDTFELIQGQFWAEGLSQDVGSTYADHFALNRQHPITQFLHGNVETASFTGRLWQWHALENITEKIETLKQWARRDDSTGRPPVLEFWVGDGSFNIFENQCLLVGVTGIQYDRPTLLGALRHVTFTLNLREYKKPDVEGGIFETRYHHAKRADYYEGLAYREYGNPTLGDVIRKRHPKTPNIQVGDIIKLPSREALRKSVVEPTSVALQGAFEKEDSPQRSLRMEMFERRNKSYISHVILEH